METPSIEEIWKKSEQHFKEDKDFQAEFRAFMVKAEPMLNAFERKKIVKSVLEEESNIWYIRAQRITTFAATLGLVYYAVKKIFNI